MMQKNIVYDKHLAWQQRVGWENRAKDNFDSQNPGMMFSTASSFNSRAKRSSSIIRMRRQGENRGEPDIKAQLVYSTQQAAWVYREPKTSPNQDYYHKGFAYQMNVLPSVKPMSRGKSHTPNLKRQQQRGKLYDQIYLRSELEDKV